LFLGDESNGKYSRNVFDFVKCDSYNFIQTNEYDGLETLQFNKDAYVFNSIGTILKDNNINNDTKISNIELLMNFEENDMIVDMEDMPITTTQTPIQFLVL
jgi:hypothetical protein